MDWVVFLGAFQLHGVKGYWACRFAGGTKTMGCASPPIAGITSDKYFIFARVNVVNYG